MNFTPARSLVLAALFAVSGSALAARPLLKSSFEQEIAATPAEVWKVIGHFSDIGWHPAAAATKLLSGDEGKAGAMRKVSVKGGGEIDEKLLALDAKKFLMKYSIVASPLPVADYVSTIEVSPAAKGHSLVRWSSEYRRKDEKPAAGADDAGAKKVVDGIYTSGLEALNKRFAAK